MSRVLAEGYRVHMRVITPSGTAMPLCNNSGGAVRFTDLAHKVTCARCRVVLTAHLDRATRKAMP